MILPFVFHHGHREINFLENPFFRSEFSGYLLVLLFFYFNYFYLIPTFYFSKKHVYFWILVIVSLLIVLAIPTLLIYQIHTSPVNIIEKEFRPHPPLFIHAEHNLAKFSLILVLSLLLRINDQWKRAQKEKTDAELSYLRAQINPHFLFNTLNSIYSMALSKSDNTPTAVVKLSAMMRYAITEAHRDLVPLEKEINYIADFVDLQKFRLGNTVKLSHRVTGDPKGKMIAPLILISIVENAFKYGVNPEENSSIMVDLTVHEYFLVFLVRNNKVRTNVAENEKSGVGIENTRNRLNMIYPGKHKFEITENPVDYSVVLTLQLS